MLMNVLIVVHVVVALAIIGLVLLQHGKGGDMGSGLSASASSGPSGRQVSADVARACLAAARAPPGPTALPPAARRLLPVFFFFFPPPRALSPPTSQPRDSGS